MGQPPGQFSSVSAVLSSLSHTEQLDIHLSWNRRNVYYPDKQTQRGGELPERTGCRGQEEIKKMVKVGVGSSDTKSMSCPPGKKGKDVLLEKLKALRQTMIRH